MSVAIVIPARYASSRYPGKPLVELKGAAGTSKTLIERSWDAAKQVSNVSRVVVATDDDRIREACEGFGAEVLMTSSDCQNGTERCAEAASQLGDVEVIVNLQGDAPLTPSWFIEGIVDGLLADDQCSIATPVLRCDGETLEALLEDRRNGRVGGTTAVFDANRHGMYFSKEVIPFTSESYATSAETPVFHHVGVYAYRPQGLAQYSGWPIGPLERLEGLEQLRFLENGHKVLCVEVTNRGRKFWELNNPEDVSKIETMMQEMNLD